MVPSLPVLGFYLVLFFGATRDRGPHASAYYAELLKSLFHALDVDVKIQETDG